MAVLKPIHHFYTVAVWVAVNHLELLRNPGLAVSNSGQI